MGRPLVLWSRGSNAVNTYPSPELPNSRGPGAPWRTWLLMISPPVLFLVVIVGASVYFGVSTGGNAQAIADAVAGSAPTILLVVQCFMLLGLWAVLRAERLSLHDIGWRVGSGQALWQEVLIGAGLGLLLAVLYILVLSPLLTTVQRAVGDYVPPGEMLPALAGAPVPFFLANVLLAPFAEESLYRGYGISALQARLGAPAAVVVSCVLFGLLHWAGGLWYVILTGAVAGGLFVGLRIGRGNIIAAYSAHLTLNLVEFFYVALWL